MLSADTVKLDREAVMDLLVEASIVADAIHTLCGVEPTPLTRSLEAQGAGRVARPPVPIERCLSQHLEAPLVPPADSGATRLLVELFHVCARELATVEEGESHEIGDDLGLLEHPRAERRAW